MNRIKSFFKHSRAAQTLFCVALDPQHLRLFVSLAICLIALGMPAMAQFSGGTTAIDPTAGAQLETQLVVDGVLKIVAGLAVVCFLWGLFRVWSRPLEGFGEMLLGLIVFGIIGHVLGWASFLTTVNIT
jgi:hypothetical protein